MRDQIKKHCANILTDLTYGTTFTTTPEHARLLPSILTPATSYLLIRMNRSNPTNRLDNWSFLLATLRKLRLPIYNSTNPPRCSCGIIHDPWGDHTFCCKKHNKKLAHNFIRDNWATTLQPAIALAGYIAPSSPLQTELPFLTPNDISARPFDISFDPEPHPSRPAACNCPYTTIGADITITHNMDPPSINLSADVQHHLKAAADKHLQDVEKAKFMRSKRAVTNPHTNTTRTVYGETILDDLLQANTILFAITLDPFGRWGPMTQALLSNSTTTIDPITFPRTRPHARTMYQRATTHPSPTGILQSADAYWKLNPTRKFYGYSHTAPTPQIHTLQQLGLGITKAFTLHIHNATRRDLLKHRTPAPHQHSPPTTINPTPHR